MAVETTEVSPAPWNFWHTIDYSNQGVPIAVHSMRMNNTSSVAVRVKVSTGRASTGNYQEWAQVVEPGEDRTLDIVATYGAPLSVRNKDYAVGFEQV